MEHRSLEDISALSPSLPLLALYRHLSRLELQLLAAVGLFRFGHWVCDLDDGIGSVGSDWLQLSSLFAPGGHLILAAMPL